MTTTGVLQPHIDGNFAELFEWSPCGLLVVDAAGIIRLVNREIERTYGYTRDELVGRPIEVLVPSAAHGAHVLAREDFHRRGESRPMGHARVVSGLRKDGTPVLAEVALMSLTMSGQPVVIASVVDVTDRERLLERLREQADALARSNADLSQFASVAAHDLQEPLRMVASYAELLDERCRGQLDDKGLKYLGYVGEGARRMQQLVRDLLAYAQVDTTDGPKAEISLDAVLAVTLANLRVAIEKAGATVTVDPLPVVCGDETQLVQVFQNLIGNALKFRREAAPTVRVSVADDGLCWRIEVADNGIGIDVRHQTRVFEMFQRLHARGQFDGHGMGLAIVQRVVQRHGGRIWFESAPGEGTRFFFTVRKG